MIYILFTIVMISVIYYEYYAHYNQLPYRLSKLNDNNLQKLGFKCLTSKVNRLDKMAQYQYKRIQLFVFQQRYTPLNVIGTIEVYCQNEKICNYSQLPKSFKTSIYKRYLELRYPILAKLVLFTSKNQSTKYKVFCEKEDLMNYPGN